MKRAILFIIISLLFYSNTNAQTYGWVNISGNVPKFPFDTTIINNGLDTIIAQFMDVSFIDDNEGWIATWHPWNDSAAVLHTTDGGNTFEVQITMRTSNAIFMVNNLIGYAGGKSGIVSKTTNGGVDWNFHGTMGSSVLTSIDFPPNSDTGYCCGFDGSIARITPSGVEPMTTPTIVDLDGISFPFKDEGWACGSMNRIIHYVNGQWVSDQSHPTTGPNCIYFIPATYHGFIQGEGKIYATIDGYNWQPNYTIPSQDHLFDFHFINGNSGWAVGSYGIILHTSNAGSSWEYQATGLTSNWLIAVYATNENNIYAVGENNTILKYTEIIGISPISGIVPEDYRLFQNYPNPFNPKTTIEFDIPKAEFTRLIIYDALGREVAVLVNEELKAGRYEVDWFAGSHSSGIYYYQLKAGDYRETRKMVFLK